MAMCAQKLTRIGASQLGVGFTTMPIPTGATTITLKAGHGVNFPIPTGGSSYWVDIVCPTGTSRAEVIGNAGNVLTVRNLTLSSGCVPSYAKVSYASSAPEHVVAIVTEMGINVVAPLQYNCDTRTLSINCEMLKSMVASPCAI